MRLNKQNVRNWGHNVIKKLEMRTIHSFMSLKKMEF
jgi:hypothetical protein